MKDMPSECTTFKELNDVSRRFDVTVPTSNDNDNLLEKGWYRFLGNSGNSMKEGYDRVVEKDASPPNFCGTEFAGTLMGSHPTPEEGMVEMTVCFRGKNCFKKGVNCDCDRRKEIYVINCINHYIYFLGPTNSRYRYCSAKTDIRKASGM